jgi:hypothetical protein
MLFLLSSAVSLSGQTSNGNIQGTVTDPSGASVAGANVTGRNLDTGLSVATVTSDAGLYSLANLPPGRYYVNVASTDLKKKLREGVNLKKRITLKLDV